MDRRTFINRWARAGVLASMALVTGVLFSRRQVSLQRECGLEFRCRECSRLSSCRLPEAEKARGIELEGGSEKEQGYEKG